MNWQRVNEWFRNTTEDDAKRLFDFIVEEAKEIGSSEGWRNALKDLAFKVTNVIEQNDAMAMCNDESDLEIDMNRPTAEIVKDEDPGK